MAYGDVDPGAVDAQRASQLRSLAARVETVVDQVLRAAQTELWECAHADDVRGRLQLHQSKARAAAQRLREEARSADNDARRRRDAAEKLGAH